MSQQIKKNKILFWRGVFALVVSVLLTTPAATQDQPTEIITGGADDPSIANPEMISRRRFEPKPIILTPASPENSQTNSASVGMIPTSTTTVFNCIPLGINTTFGFSGFIYRNVPPFTLLPGDQFAFDLGAQNNVDVRRNVYFGVANKNPAPGGCGTNVVSQGIKSLGWTQVVSDSQMPLNPRGNTVKGDYELVFTAETMFQFPGGGFIIGFGGSPPGAYKDINCEQVMVVTSCSDASGSFYARFFLKPDRTLGVLDVLTGGNGTGQSLGGIMLWPSVGSNQPPVARCTNVTVPVGSNCTAMASVDNGSYDPDGDSITVSQSPPGPYPVGTTTVTLMVTDSQGASSSCTATITVVDITPPTVMMNAIPTTLWPPNHQYMTVKVADCVVSAGDACDSSVGLNKVVISTVSSDEPEDVTGDGDGNTLNDMIIAADCQSVQLRAERRGNGNGRVYTITFEVRDAAGNSATATGRVAVPLNQGRTGAAQDDGPVDSVNSLCP